jgi:leucyl-tRNA synthetase
MSEEIIKEKARNEPQIQRYLAGNSIKKTIVVPGRLINFVI